MEPLNKEESAKARGRGRPSDAVKHLIRWVPKGSGLRAIVYGVAIAVMS